MLHLAVESAFDDLLARWRAHQSKQSRPTIPVTELAASRQQLDKARYRMHKLRTSIYPTVDEHQSIIEAVWCDTLDVVVHFQWADRHPTRPGTFECPCGQLVPINWRGTMGR